MVHLGAEVREFFGFVGLCGAVDSDGLQVSDLAVVFELVDAVGDSSAETDVVDEYGFDTVGLCDLDGSAGGVHEVGFSMGDEVDDFGSASHDGDGLVVSESCDVESHDGFFVASVVECPSDGLLDRFEGYQSVVSGVGELSEHSDLICGRGVAVLVEDVVGPWSGGESRGVSGFSGLEIEFDVRGVECGDVNGFPVLPVFVECVVEGAGEACGVSDHEHLRVVGCHRPDDGVEDELPDAGCFVDDDENVFVVEALESFGGVGGESVGESFV